MTRAVYLLGAPGVGKSSVMTELLCGWQRTPARPLARKLTAEYLVNPQTGEVEGVHLGRRRAHFSGTDALPMDVHPDAVGWAERAPLPGRVYGEGQRLGTSGFLTALAARADLRVFLLTASPPVLTARLARRSTQQADGWRKGAATKAQAAADRCEIEGIRVGTIDTSDRTPSEVATAIIVASAPW